MDNQRVVKTVKELCGWRECTSEELKVTQGLLLANLKSTHRTGRGMFILIDALALIFMYNIIPILFECVMNKDFRRFFGGMILMCVCFFWIFGSFRELLNNYYKNMKKVILCGNIKIIDVEVLEVEGRTDYEGAIRDYWAKIQDLEGNRYEKTIYVLSAENSIEKGRALLIYAESKGDTKEIIIPYKEKSPKTWEAGLHLYKKNVK